MALTLNLSAQQRCATVEYRQNRVLQKIAPEDPDFESWLAKKVASRAAARPQTSTYYIPVVVHIVHNGEPVGVDTNIPEAQVLSQLAVLNKDYKRLNTDASNTPTEFASLAGAVDIEFVLARQTPDGLPTNGIVRVKGSKSAWSLSDDDQLKAQSYWPSADYLNIWVCKLSAYLGYAQFPVSNLPGLEDYQGNIAATDGAVFSYRDFGSSYEGFGAFATLQENYDRGRTATHEIGHFLGLRHIWGDRNACTGSDYVDDTPTQREETYNCPSHPMPTSSWCNSKAPMFQNYMDYTDDACMNLFTQGQITRMTSVLENSPRRLSLLTSHGLLEPNPVPNDVALKMILDLSVISCQQNPTPKLLIQNSGTNELTSFTLSYTINDGTPVILSFPNLQVPSGGQLQVSVPGISLPAAQNELSFTLTQPNGVDDENPFNNSLQKIVFRDATRGSIPLTVNFTTLPATGWNTFNAGGDGEEWEAVQTDETINNAKNTALVFKAIGNVLTSDQAWFVSPVLDFSKTARATLLFDWSYARRSGYTDNVTIMISPDCGVTFTELYTVALSKAPASQAAWIPSAAGDWINESINLDAYAGLEDVRLAFVFNNGNGNNFYLDNINFFVPQQFQLYPNPASESIAIAFNFQEAAPASIEIIDALGKIVYHESVPEVRNEDYPVAIASLRPGVYVVRVRASGQVWTTRLVRSGQ